MKHEEFKKSPAGRLVPTIQGAWSFVPNPLPPAIALEPIIQLLAEAATCFGELRGVGRTLPNPYLLVRPFQGREAVASSNIEGTFTSLSDLFMFEAGADERKRPPDTREVHNYVRALEHGLKRLTELPKCLRLIRELHEILLVDLPVDRGGRMTPGEFRKEQNWIGGSRRDIASARFVPPPVNELMPALSAFEKYIQDDPKDQFPVLVKLALIHYQFEAIHPFPDGNGRVGRMLIPLILAEKGELDQPLLLLSPYFERNKDEYIDRLFEVSRSGDWHGWIGFFLRGIIDQARDTTARIKRLQDLQVRYRARLQQNRASASVLMLCDYVFEQPVVSVPRAKKMTGLTYAGAKNAITKLTDAEILVPAAGETRPQLFVATEVMDAVLNE